VPLLLAAFWMAWAIGQSSPVTASRRMTQLWSSGARSASVSGCFGTRKRIDVTDRCGDSASGNTVHSSKWSGCDTSIVFGNRTKFVIT
jgi:hypothetical protein